MRAYLRQHARRMVPSLIILTLLLLSVAGVQPLGFMQRLENYSYDLRLQWTMPGGIDHRIVIVDLDERSLQEQGHWPWPRNKLAHLTDLLFDRYKIDVLGFDMVFPERDESSGLGNLQALGRAELLGDSGFATALDKLRPQLMYDQIFANSLKNRRVALGYYFSHGRLPSSGVGQVGQLPAPVLPPGSFDPSTSGRRRPVALSPICRSCNRRPVPAAFLTPRRWWMWMACFGAYHCCKCLTEPCTTRWAWRWPGWRCASQPYNWCTRVEK
jgi:hypothetical protein